MTVKELIEALSRMNQEALVVMAKDAEGNDFSPLSELDEYLYMAESAWSGWLDDRDGEPAVCLWPVN